MAGGGLIGGLLVAGGAFIGGLLVAGEVLIAGLAWAGACIVGLDDGADISGFVDSSSIAAESKIKANFFAD